ncbi:RHS domain-containing protein [Acinetobacter rudis]|uniref:RHS domain-containing protein n=1 Tax=Acinetobacter rudis TaxID=632955 RepID=UPI00039E4EFB|nr:RHS domain-containing protein [Acinetobacter rudis]
MWHEDKQVEKFDLVWFYHCDHLSIPEEMSDQTGTIVWTAQYKEWVSEDKKNKIFPEHKTRVMLELKV